MVGRDRRAEIVQLGVEDLEIVGRVGDDLLFRITQRFQIAQGHISQPVAGCADLGIDLKTALQLVLIPGSERTLEREVEILDMLLAATCRKGCSRGQSEGKRGADCKFLEHVSGPSSYSAGVASASALP